MNKYAFGTVFGSALLGLLNKNLGSLGLRKIKIKDSFNFYVTLKYNSYAVINTHDNSVFTPSLEEAITAATETFEKIYQVKSGQVQWGDENNVYSILRKVPTGYNSEELWDYSVNTFESAIITTPAVTIQNISTTNQPYINSAQIVFSFPIEKQVEREFEEEKEYMERNFPNEEWSKKIVRENLINNFKRYEVFREGNYYWAIVEILYYALHNLYGPSYDILNGRNYLLHELGTRLLKRPLQRSRYNQEDQDENKNYIPENILVNPFGFEIASTKSKLRRR